MIVHGHRDAPDAAIRINDRPVSPRGGAHWRVALPVETVRGWSAPFARAITVAEERLDGTAVRSTEVPLPVGLLAGRIELASLVVHAR